MNKTYMHKESGRLATSTALSLQGLVQDNQIAAAGYVLITYVYPVFNKDTHYITPDGPPMLNESQTGATQNFIIESLPSDVALGNVKTSKLKSINEAYTNASSVIKADTPDDEVTTWTIQKLEAEAYLKDNSIATPFIDGIANARGVDRILLINKVLEKVALADPLSSGLTGKRQKYEDQILAALTVEEVFEIQWED